ncbi:hypothetical protein P405_01235 [Streptomyces sp. FR-008]|nr:hydrolase [Streptomyces sp. FR-008]KAF0795600.1 hypothetical protein P405_01235 [Streptomyces sp. FR-008]
MADDAVAVMDALGWPSAHLVGVSLGGAVAQRVALRHPGRVRTLTSVAAVPGDLGGLRTLRYVRLATLAKFARLNVPDTHEGAVAAGVAVSRLLASPHRAFDEAAARAAAERNADRGVGDQRAQSRQIAARWHGPPVEAVTRPTLVVHGEDDPPHQGPRRPRARLPDSRSTAAAPPGNRPRTPRTRLGTPRHRDRPTRRGRGRQVNTSGRTRP